MGKKKKIGSVGRFGPRYGRRVKIALRGIEKAKRTSYLCPRCKKVAVKRNAAGIWICKKCNTKFASGAYSFTIK